MNKYNVIRIPVELIGVPIVSWDQYEEPEYDPEVTKALDAVEKFYQEKDDET